MSRPLQVWLSLVLALVVSTTGCGPGATLTAEQLDLIQQIQSAPDLVRHSGVRRIESEYQLGGTSGSLVYRERYSTDGLGHFAITPLGAVQGGSMVSPSEFVTIQMARAGFYHRYRDFRVRDLAAFLENYQLTSNGELVQVAGRDCLQLAVARKDASSSYEVALDITTGQVLRYREFDATGALFSSMEYETYNANPDLTQVEFHQQTNQEQPLVSVADLGFSPLIPTLLPDASFTFLEASVVVDSSTGQKLAKFTFTDGVETIFFLDGGVAPITPPKFGAPPVAAGGGQGDSVNVFHEGALTVMWGQVQGHAVYLVGKVPQDELKQTLQSALR